MTKFFRQPLFILFLTLFMVLVGIGIIIPILPFYAQSMGASPMDLGLIFASFSLMQFLCSPLWGRAADRFGRRPILIIGLSGIGVAFLLVALAQNLLMLYVARILGGILSSAAMPSAFAYVSDSTTPDKRGKSMGLMGAAMSLGLILGPALGGFLGDAVSPVFPFFVASVLSFLVALFAFLFLPESLKQTTGAGGQAPRHWGLEFTRLWTSLRGPVGVILLVGMATNIALSSLFIALPLYGEEKFDFDGSDMGLFFVLLGVLGALTQGVLSGRAIASWGEGRVAQIGLWMSGVGFVILLLATDLTSLLVLSTMLGVGSALIGPALTSLISKRSGHDEQGVVMGLFNSYQSLGRILGPLLGGEVMLLAGFEIPFIVAGALFLLTGLAALMSLKSDLGASMEASD